MGILQKEVHPRAIQHILRELMKREKVAVDKFGAPAPTVRQMNQKGEGVQIFEIDGQPLTHIIPEHASWLTGPRFEILVYPEAVAILMEEILQVTSPFVNTEIEDDLRLRSRNSPWS